MEQSQYHVYSVGIVAANKHLDSDDIYVTPIEVTPFLDGELDARPQDLESQGVDADDQAYTVKVSTSTAIKATWLRETHRRTSPDVRRGERVLIWQYGDTDKFYWSSMGMDDNLRKLETVIYSWSATQDEGADSTDPEKCYSLEVCTHTKQITLRTVKADGEPFAYTVQLNTKEGAVVLTDDVGNYFTLDSAETLIRAENRAGSFLELNKKNISFLAPDNISGEAGKDISLKAGNNINVNAGGNISSEAGGNVTEKAGGNITQEAGGNVNSKAGGTATVEGGAGAFLKCGGVQIGVTGGGVSMSG